MIPPIVRQMIVCDEIVADPKNGNRLNTMGLAQSISPSKGDDYPLKHPKLSVLISFSGGVGSGRFHVAIRSEETGEVIRKTDIHTIQHHAQRNHVSGVTIRIVDCVFEEPGVYWIEFVYEGRVLSQYPLFLRPPR